MMKNRTIKPSSQEAKVLEMASDLGILRPRDLCSQGLSVAYIQRLLAKGLLVKLGRGQYTLPEREPSEYETLAVTANRYPGTVVCLLSALRFHDLTTQSPGSLWLAIEGTKLAPANAPAAIEIVRLTGPTFHQGIEIHELGQVPVRIYEPAKTVVDCFKLRNRVGMDVAIDALKDCLRQRQATPEQIWKFAEMCRVKTVIRPYLEALA
jgi:predicted transcriptional regulator of viral defense system